MKTIVFTLIAVCLLRISVYAQNTFPSTGAAGIGTPIPIASSLLEVKSTSKGLHNENLLAGVGTITIHGNELNGGEYQYSLIIDNKKIDSKQMVLTK